MKKRKWMAVLLGLALAFGIPTAQAEVQVKPIEHMRADFIKGADVSMLHDLEKNGAKFYDTDGQEMDNLAIMTKHGVNWIRLRGWNHPSQGGGAGAMNAKKAIVMTERAHALGMKVLIDFHYSDTWADPSHQTPPLVWQKHDLAQLQQDVYDYTKETLERFADEEQTPEMVQVGNEITNGMLWPAGQLPAKDDGKAFASLVEAGLRAVHDVDLADGRKDIRTMIHIDRGGDNKVSRDFFDQLILRNGVNDFDVIGLSFYPFWNGRPAKLEANMTDLAARYKKDVCVAETAYAFTLDNYDEQGNNFTAKEAGMGGYSVSPQGQADAIRDVMQAVADVPDGRGLGVFYWEPDWIVVPGCGAGGGWGNGWENLAMFDKNGKALESWKVFEVK